MEFIKKYTVNEAHIDVQNIVDGLYYPFYMEDCRHAFIREVLGFDFETEARNGVYMILSHYSIKFVRSLKKGDEFTVSCSLFRDSSGLPRLHFKQIIMHNNKVMTKGFFTGTCIPANGWRPYLPKAILEMLEEVPFL